MSETHPHAARSWRAVPLALALVVAAPAGAAPPDDSVPDPAPAPPPRLTLDVVPAAVIAGGALAVWGASALVDAHAGVQHCRWCNPPELDRWARTELRWGNPAAAGHASDALLLTVTLGSTVAVAASAASGGTSRWEIVEDLVAFGDALAVSQALTAVAKTTALRLRPDAWAAGGASTSTDVHSFFSGHTSATFAAAAAATQVTRLRGRPAWRWIAVVGFAGAAATGWLRVAADEHWLTDVLAGAAVGTASGVAVPLLVLRPASAQPSRVTLAPAPGGLAVAGVF